jgi:hypothetical protein
VDQVNERTSCTITVSWLDEDAAPVTPQSATYRLDDVTSGTVLVAATAIGSLSTTNDIAITKDSNKILSEAHPFETRRLTVEFTYATSKHGTEEYLYRVKNLFGVETVSSASSSPSASAS